MNSGMQGELRKMGKIWVFEGRNGRVWPQAARAAADSRANGRRAVVYVPEQMTLQTERDLITDLKLKGLLETEVISPRKLRFLVREKTGGGARRTLDEYGQTMAVHRAMTETKDHLAYYRNMTELPGAVEKIREALSELRESEITPEETEQYALQAENGAVRSKLLDLNRIRGAYEALVAEHFEDEKTAWTDTVRRLGRTDLLRNADFIAWGFDTIRPDLRELLCATCAMAENVYVFLTADRADAPDGAVFREQQQSIRKLEEAVRAAGGEIRTVRITEAREGCDPMLDWMDTHLFADLPEKYPGKTGDGISLYAAHDLENEAEQIAECLLDWHGKGIPWDRMAVALPKQSLPESMLLSRLRLSGIPFYTAEKTPAVSHGVCRLLTAALACISEGYSTEAVADAASSGFSTLTDEEALLLENYALAHGTEGNRWRQPFTRGEGAEEAERIRQKLTGPFEHLRENLKRAGSATESVEAVVRFLEEENVWARLQEREEALLRDGLYREAVTDRQVWKLLTEILDQLWTLLGSRRASMRDLKNMLECALGSAEIASLPETESGVAVGEVGHMQTDRLDALILPGCQDGVLSAGDTGWLSDREREKLEQATGREVGITRGRRGDIRKFDFYRTMTAPRKFLRLSWSLQDGKGSPLREDELIARIRGIFPEIRTEGGVREKQEDFSPRTPLKALESMGSLLEAVREGRGEETADSAVIALLHDGVYGRTVREMLEETRPGKTFPALLPETARELFRTDSSSISRLEGYAACPYRHFIDYGLRPVRQENYEFDNADAGSFFHAALDRFMKTAGGEKEWPDLRDEQVDGMMDAICAELTEEWDGSSLREDAMGIWQGEEYLRRIHHAARVLTRFAANSDFRTIATERSFGRDDGLPPMILHLADGSEVKLQGIIDRIDTYENGEGIWLRVVDNKSSLKKPDPAKMADGEQLQLMIYLKAVLRAYPGSRPAGAMFFPIQDAEISPADESPETLEAERLKKVRMKGIINAREDVVRAMDRDRKPWSVDEVFTRDGSIRKGADWVVEEGVLQGLMEAAEQKATEICGEIRNGRIEPLPRGSGEENSPCRYCGYRTLCHTLPQGTHPREEEITFRDIARRAEAAAGKTTLRDNEK